MISTDPNNRLPFPEPGQTVTIQFSNEQTDGFVVIDALQLVKHLRPK
ncbi:MAG: hypothetical protein QGF59_13210 [Pirellulaceae bacterium]|nr:hypothetical protein [Pirellulaceae bacterium]